jgi:hypothetical protein
MDPQVSIVVVTSDRLVDLRRCLQSLRNHLREPGAPTTEVRTVHAPHDTVAMAMVRTEFPEVHVHTAPRGTSACSATSARARRAAPWSSTSTTMPGPIPAGCRSCGRPSPTHGVVAASGPVQRGDGSLQCERLASSPIGRLLPLAAGQALPTGFAPSFSGCNLALRRSTLFACGGFDENLSYQPDDMDVTARLFAHAGRDPATFRYCELARVTHESSPGPYRRTLEDRAWFVVARDNLYYACRHGGAVRGVLGGVALQVPKFGRFFAWWWQGKLGFAAALRCFGKHLSGTLAGVAKGLLRGPRLPLEPPAGGCAAARRRRTQHREGAVVPTPPAGVNGIADAARCVAVVVHYVDATGDPSGAWPRCWPSNRRRASWWSTTRRRTNPDPCSTRRSKAFVKSSCCTPPRTAASEPAAIAASNWHSPAGPNSSTCCC